VTDDNAKAPGMISAGELAAFVTRVFASRGMQEAHAAQVADVLTWADLRGIDSHGVERVPSYLNLIANGSINPHARRVSTMRRRRCSASTRIAPPAPCR
jgi:ureidoglycolate dehydrogenase (NAD+)